MMYPFMTLDDDTEIVHSEMKPDGRVKVYLEKPDAEDCFHSAVCWLPGYDWQEVHGFTPDDVRKDGEGLQTMRTLAQNMAWLLKNIQAGKDHGVPFPQYEARISTHFI